MTTDLKWRGHHSTPGQTLLIIWSKGNFQANLNLVLHNLVVSEHYQHLSEHLMDKMMQWSEERWKCGSPGITELTTPTMAQATAGQSTPPSRELNRNKANHCSWQHIGERRIFQRGEGGWRSTKRRRSHWLPLQVVFNPFIVLGCMCGWERETHTHTEWCVEENGTKVRRADWGR